MPAFSFEKISPPMRRASVAATSVVRKQPGVIVQMLDRLAKARVKRALAAKSKPAPKRD